MTYGSEISSWEKKKAIELKADYVIIADSPSPFCYEDTYAEYVLPGEDLREAMIKILNTVNDCEYNHTIENIYKRVGRRFIPLDDWGF